MHNENFKTIAMMISGGDAPRMNAAIESYKVFKLK